MTYPTPAMVLTTLGLCVTACSPEEPLAEKWLWGSDCPADDALFVSASAGQGGSGTQDEPYRSVGAALASAAEGGASTICVAAGSYQESLSLGPEHSGITILGVGKDQVSLDVSGGEQEGVGIWADLGSDGSFVLSGLSVVDAETVGILISSGTLSVQQARVARCGMIGIQAFQGGSVDIVETDIEDNLVYGVIVDHSAATITDSTISGTLPNEEGDYGFGVSVEAGATLTMSGSEVAENTRYGVFVREAVLATITDTNIRDTRSSPDGSAGDGLYATGGTHVEVFDSFIVDNTYGGIRAYGTGVAGSTTLLVDGTEITGTVPNDEGEARAGIEVNEGTTLEIRDSLLGSNSCSGLLVFDDVSSAVLEGVEIRDSDPTLSCEYPSSVYVKDGSLTMNDGTLEGNHVGVYAYGSSASVVLNDTVFRDTKASLQAEASQPDAGAIVARGGASITAENCTLEESEYIGAYTDDPGSRIDFIGGSISNMLPPQYSLGATAFLAIDGGTITATGTEISGTFGHGVIAMADGVIELTDVKITDTQAVPDDQGMMACAVCAYSGASIELYNSSVRDNEIYGVWVEGEGTELTMVASEVGGTVGLPGSVKTGLVAWGACSVSIQGSSFFDNRSMAIVGVHDAHIEVDDTSVDGTRWDYNESMAAGIYIAHDAVLDAIGLEVTETEGPALWVSWDGWLGCADCAIAGAQAAGVVARDGGTLELYNTTIDGTDSNVNEGGGVGVWASQGASPSTSVYLSGVTVANSAAGGAWFGGLGSYQVLDSSIDGAEHAWYGDAIYATDGVPAWDGGTGLRIEHSELGNAGRAGLFLDGALAGLEDVGWSSNAVDVHAQGESCEPLPEGWGGAGTIQACFGGVLRHFDLDLDLADSLSE